MSTARRRCSCSLIVKATTAADEPRLARLLAQAEDNGYLTGYVLSRPKSTIRHVLYVGGVPVGFFTPRQEGQRWRVGAIYVLPEYRKRSIGLSYAELALRSFIRGKEVLTLVDSDNVSAQRLFERLGFNASRQREESSHLLTYIYGPS